MIKRLLIVLMLALLPQLASAQVVSQGTPAATTDSDSWPIKVVFGNAQIDPRAIRTLTIGDQVTAILGASTSVIGHVVVDSAPTTAVTGTFWQATQPVSGTFWQATQPVSLASLPALAAGAAVIGHVIVDTAPTTAVTGAFFQVTQPVSLASLPALAAGSAVIGHVIVDTAPTTAVTAASLPLPALAATSTKQSDGTQKTQVVDGSGNVIGATVNALDINIKSGNPTSITANAGTNLNTSALALDATVTTLDTDVKSNVTLHAGANVIGHVINDTGSTTAVTGNVTVVQPTGTNLHTVCDSGCGSATPFADNAAFTASTTSVANTGYVVDETATNAVTEDHAGAPRMSASRVALANLRDASGNEVGTDTHAPSTNNIRALVVRNMNYAPLTGRTSQQWTSATALNSTAALSSSGDSGQVNPLGFEISLSVTGTVTGGVITFEANDNNVNYYNIMAVRSDNTAIESTYDFGVNQSRHWYVIAGQHAAQVRLSSVVVGSGSITLDYTPIYSPIPQALTSVVNNGTFPVQAAPPTLTKGTQGATGFSTQDLKDAGRTLVTFTAERVVPVLTTDTVVSFSKLVGDTVTAAQTTYQVTSGKTLRLQYMTISLTPSSTTLGLVQVRLRTLSSGACIVATGVKVAGWEVGNQGSATQVANAANQREDIVFPDGMEFSGATRNICISMNALGAAAQTVTISLVGYEY